MKLNTVILCLIVFVVIVKALDEKHEPEKQEPKLESENKELDYKITFLFEKDGVKVYRFFDPVYFHLIYYTDARGATTQGKIRVESN